MPPVPAVVVILEEQKQEYSTTMIARHAFTEMKANLAQSNTYKHYLLHVKDFDYDFKFRVLLLSIKKVLFSLLLLAVYCGTSFTARSFENGIFIIL